MQLYLKIKIRRKENIMFKGNKTILILVFAAVLLQGSPDKIYAGNRKTNDGR